MIRNLKLLSITEYKLLFFVLSKRKTGENELEFSVNEFEKKMNITKGGFQRKLIKNSVKSIMASSFVNIPKEKSPTNEEIFAYIIYLTRYNDETNKITAKIPEEIVPFLDNLDDDYTWIALKNVSNLSNKYSSFTFLELYPFVCCNYKKNKLNYTLYIDKFKEKLESENSELNGFSKKYKNFNDFEKYVLIPAFNDINSKCKEFSISYDRKDVIKKGKGGKIIAIKLTLRNDNVNNYENPYLYLLEEIKYELDKLELNNKNKLVIQKLKECKNKFEELLDPKNNGYAFSFEASFIFKEAKEIMQLFQLYCNYDLGRKDEFSTYYNKNEIKFWIDYIIY